jgi:hypothetical protein
MLAGLAVRTLVWALTYCAPNIRDAKVATKAAQKFRRDILNILRRVEPSMLFSSVLRKNRVVVSSRLT